jgi:DNA/RNA endonuclease G (NUC1)
MLLLPMLHCLLTSVVIQVIMLLVVMTKDILPMMHIKVGIEQVEYESFLMSNMSPQLPGLNRGIWKLLETSTGSWTFSRNHTLLVYAGNIYTVGKDKTIGVNKVTVPNKLWKIVVDTQTKEVLAFLFPQAENQGNDLTKVQVSVADVEAATGLTIPLPSGADKHAKPALWAVDFKALTAAKKTVCKGDPGND